MADDKEKKEEVLDLLSEKPKPSRRERQRQEAAKVQTVDDKKKAALDLGIEEDQPKKSSVRKTEKSGKDILPSISNRLEDKADPDFVKSYANSKKKAEAKGEEFVPMHQREIVALIAYIQRLGTDIKVKDKK